MPGRGGREPIRRTRCRTSRWVTSGPSWIRDSISIAARDAVINKRMASVFHDTLIPSLLVWHKVDTVILTGGSTSGCIRASCVASLSTGYRTIVPEECVADKHEIPHFANLCDMMLKYADVEPVAARQAVVLANHPGCEPIRDAARGCDFYRVCLH